MPEKKIDIGSVIYALDCRAKGPRDKGSCYDQEFPEGSLPGFEKRLCDECPYYYDYGGCDIEQILIDAKAWIEQTRKEVRELKKAAQS